MEKPNGKRIVDTVFINDREIVIRELTVGEILDLIGGVEETDLASLGDNAGKFLEVACGLELSDLKAYTPSQIKQLYEKFREVNAAFFDLARQMQAGDMVDLLITEIKRSLADDFKRLCSASSSPATSMPGTTGSPPLSPPTTRT